MGPENISHLKCIICGKEYPSEQVDYVCPDHGTEGVLDVQYDYDHIRKNISKKSLQQNPDHTIWRYKPLLPVSPDSPVPQLAVGGTPLYDGVNLSQKLGLKKIWVKDDGLQPTASFKDRASAMAIVKGREKGAEVITTASTGNAAAALSGLCAAMNQKNMIFVPDSAPQAKIAQLLAFGSTVMLVKGTYDDAFDLCMSAAHEYGWYNRNTGYNPYMTEGKKTAAFEICEQLNWNTPDRIFVSVGDGCIIGGIHKGLKDLKAMGWIERIPKLVGVQAEGSSFLYQAWKNNEDVLTKPPIQANTVADSISAGLPRDRLKAMAAVKESQGEFISVSDTEILTAMIELARSTGVFSEPAGAAATAGLIKAVNEGRCRSDETVVVINTGNGLKDIPTVMTAVEKSGTQPFRLEPDMDQLRQFMSNI
ncbi:MAG: threonine synthase [Deltaproteobacteria bacterium]|nr:threonine synthase [Deltaproteobacteria bacterium]